MTNSCKGRSFPRKYLFVYHDCDLSIIGSSHRSKTPEYKIARSTALAKYRINHGKPIDIYTNTGFYIETLPAVRDARDKYHLKESYIIKIKHFKSHSPKYIFRDIGDRRNYIGLYHNKRIIGTVKYVVAKLNKPPVEYFAYSKVIEVFNLKFRDEGKQKIMCLKLGEQIDLNGSTVTLLPIFENEDILTSCKQEEIESKIIKDKYNIIYV